MPRILLIIACAALIIFSFRQWTRPSDTHQAVYQACLLSSGGNDRRCLCFADFLHEHLSDAELQAMINERVVSFSLQQRIESLVSEGSARCQ